MRREKQVSRETQVNVETIPLPLLVLKISRYLSCMPLILQQETVILLKRCSDQHKNY